MDDAPLDLMTVSDTGPGVPAGATFVITLPASGSR